jgi:hypothetical protein
MTAPDNTTDLDAAAAAHIEDALDEALDESFPASDPVAISTGTSAHDEAKLASNT